MSGTAVLGMTQSISLNPPDAAAVQTFAQAARAALGANLIHLRLFGSKVRGDAAPDSDIDIAVIVQNGEASVRDAVIDIAFDVNMAHDVYISPRVIPQSVLNDPVWRITGFLRAVEREGVPIP